MVQRNVFVIVKIEIKYIIKTSCQCQLGLVPLESQ